MATSAFNAAEIPGLLGAMGVINTVIVFAYSTALNRKAGLRYRRPAACVFAAGWLATLAIVVAYVWHSLRGVDTRLLIDAGLLIWVCSFPVILTLVYLAARSSVGRGGRRYEADPGFEDRTAWADFGVGAVDAVLRRSIRARGRVTYPFLLLHDIDSPGLTMAGAFAAAGLRAGEAVVYLTFSRPWTTIATQLARAGAAQGQAWIVDCYSSVYMPEARRKAGARVSFADARDPSSVYRQYLRALAEARRLHASVRSVYEKLSDFAKITDSDLVMDYLRRVVVLEEARHVRALYVVWKDMIEGDVDQSYLRWFFSTSIEMTRQDAMAATNRTAISFRRFYADPVTVTADHALELDESGLFRVDGERVTALGQALARLGYRPKPYDFLAEVTGAARATIVGGFVFFMVAIDHDTHRPGRRFEAHVDGRRLHGSDLMYALGERAKRAEPTLFLAHRFATIGADTVERIFTAPNGAVPADIGGRTALFNACARTLLEAYDGDVARLLAAAAGRLGGADGLLARLRAFTAYGDPIGKKSALLAKVLRREGLFAPEDPALIEVPVDHVVMTVALRSGAVACGDEEARRRIADGVPLDPFQMDLLRETVREAMRRLVTASGRAADEIDDVLRAYGRESPLATPLPAPGGVHSGLDAQVRAEALPGFVAVLNGIDGAGEGRWPEARTVRGPFTSFF